MLLILNEYKTSKRYGENSEKMIEVNPEVAQVIKTYLNHHDTGYLLKQANNYTNPMETHVVTRALQKQLFAGI
eukprot:SAG11_NODE_16050_length_558_cov_1.000000_2_plen_73_part_00